MAGTSSARASIEYDLTTRKWKSIREKGAAGASLPWRTPPDVSEESLRGVSVKGRSSHEEKEAWSRGGHLLLSDSPWAITRDTDLEEVEQMVVVLAVRHPPLAAAAAAACPSCFQLAASRGSRG